MSKAAKGYYGSLSDKKELGYKEWRSRWASQLKGQCLNVVRHRYISYCTSWRINNKVEAS